MAIYRLYFIDWPSGRIGRVADLEACDDDEAIRLAGGHEAFELVELWCGDRRICRFEARPRPVPRPAN